MLNIPLLNKIIETKKEIIISSGMSDMEELDYVVNILKESKSKFYLMQCTSAYPTPLENVNLNVIPTLQNRYNIPIGLSDHTQASLLCLSYL